MDEQDTIVAIATPPGRGGIGIVRLSGLRSVAIATPLLRLSSPLISAQARFAKIIDPATGEVLDEAVVTWFAAPRSYTGEDVVEIAAHGSPVILDFLLRACCADGARLAEPGEFTERAFLAGRLDLTQAEAVADLIDASTIEQARVAARQLGGALSRQVAPPKEKLVALIAEMEAGIDFAEDDIAVMPAATIAAALEEVAQILQALAQTFAYGRVLREGFSLALVGRPNAGKSSLFNRLLKRDRAIVTATPGTTRDTVTERMALDGIPVELVDTAGLRAPSEAGDEAERLGMARSREAMAEAAMVLLVVDATVGIGAEDQALLDACAGRPLVLALNKADLAVQRAEQSTGVPTVWTSALTGEGVPELRATIHTMLGGHSNQGALVTNLRQQQTIADALAALHTAKGALAQNVPHEVLLLDLYAALRALDDLTGATTADDVLKLIFGRFCIGK